VIEVRVHEGRDYNADETAQGAGQDAETCKIQVVDAIEGERDPKGNHAERRHQGRREQPAPFNDLWIDRDHLHGVKMAIIVPAVVIRTTWQAVCVVVPLTAR